MTKKLQLAYTVFLSAICFSATAVLAQEPAPATAPAPASGDHLAIADQAGVSG